MSLDSPQPAADRAAAAAAAIVVVLVVPLVVFFSIIFFIVYFNIDKQVCCMSAISSHRVTVISAGELQPCTFCQIVNYSYYSHK